MALLLLFLGSALWLALPPDEEFEMERVAPATVSSEVLGESLLRLTAWPLWHHHLKKVSLLNVSGEPYPESEQRATPGGMLRFEFENPEKTWKHFTLDAEIVAYEPEKLLKIRVLRDSTARITRLAQGLEWQIQVQNSEQGAEVRALVRMKSQNWRGRLLGRMTRKILLNQLLKVDVVKLAHLKREEVQKALIQPQSGI
jgi:hypothetical protein